MRGFRFSCLRPAADETPRRTKEKTSGTQGTGTFAFKRKIFRCTPFSYIYKQMIYQDKLDNQD